MKKYNYGAIFRVIHEGQRVGILVLYAEARLGELLSLEPQQEIIRIKGESSARGTLSKLPNGISKKLSHYAMEIHRNDDLIIVALEKAVKRETIPTRYDVKVSF